VGKGQGAKNKKPSFRPFDKNRPELKFELKGRAVSAQQRAQPPKISNTA
jgi:hypothetical protein